MVKHIFEKVIGIVFPTLPFQRTFRESKEVLLHCYGKERKLLKFSTGRIESDTYGSHDKLPLDSMATFLL